MQIPEIHSFLDYHDGVHQRTRRVIDHIPPERMEWSHAPARFTFGDLVRHIAATERWMFAENATGGPSRYPGHGRELADGPEAVVAYFERMHHEAAAMLARLTPEDLRRRCTTPAGTPITTWKWLRAMVEHEVHHRGQIYLMLGILEVPTPPIYGLTEAEVRAGSEPLEGG